MERKRCAKTSQQQFRIYLDFLNSHPVLRTGRLTPQMGPQELEQLWEQVAQLLNSCGSGPQKDVKGWKHVFTDWRSSVKRKSRLYLAEMRKTGGGPMITKPLTPLETELLQSLRPVLINGIEGVEEVTGLKVPHRWSPPTTATPPSTVASTAGIELPPPPPPPSPPPTVLPSLSPTSSPPQQHPTEASTSWGDPSRASTSFGLQNRRICRRRSTITSNVVQAFRESNESIASALNRIANALVEQNRIKAEKAKIKAEGIKIKALKLKLEIVKARKNGIEVDFDV